MAFGKKDEKLIGGSGFIPKNITPGKRKCKVLGIRLGNVKWDDKDAIFLNLKLEQEKPSDDFEGFYIDKDKPKKGRHEGPSGSVASNPFPYQDGKVKDKNNGGYKEKEMLAVQFLHFLCLEANGSTWAQDNLGKHETFEAYIEAFNKEQPIKDEYIYFIIQGNKVLNDKGYWGFERLAVTFPTKEERATKLKSFSKEEDVLIDFDKTRHIYDKTGGAEVESFEGKAEAAPIEDEDDDDGINFEKSEEVDEDDVFSVEDKSESDEEEGDDIEDVFNVE